jgi:hypothetical protein
MKRLLVLVVSMAAATAGAVEKRPVPDYDGRPDAGPSAGEVALWVPRVAVAPLWLTSEYLVRRPLGWLVVTGERERWPEKLIDVFTTEDRKLGVIPWFYVERGFHPVAGVYLFADDAGAAGNQLRLSASAGSGHQSLTVIDRLARGRLSLSVRGHVSRRDDYRLELGRYGATKAQLSASVGWRAGDLRAHLETGARSVSTFTSTYGGEPPADPGRSYAGVFERLELALDTREAGGGGAWLWGDVEHGPHHVRASASAGVAAGLGRGRVLSLGAGAALVEGIDGEVPIAELVSADALNGFAAGRLAGESALTLAARYEWPVAPWLNGALQAGAGNVFGERWDGADLDLLRLSGSVGLRTSGSPDQAFQVLLAMGTETLADGAGIDSVRLVLGGSTGF